MGNTISHQLSLSRYHHKIGILHKLARLRKKEKQKSIGTSAYIKGSIYVASQVEFDSISNTSVLYITVVLWSSSCRTPMEMLHWQERQKLWM